MASGANELPLYTLVPTVETRKNGAASSTASFRLVSGGDDLPGLWRCDDIHDHKNAFLTGARRHGQRPSASPVSWNRCVPASRKCPCRATGAARSAHQRRRCPRARTPRLAAGRQGRAMPLPVRRCGEQVVRTHQVVSVPRFLPRVPSAPACCDARVRCPAERISSLLHDPPKGFGWILGRSSGPVPLDLLHPLLGESGGVVRSDLARAQAWDAGSSANR